MYNRLLVVLLSCISMSLMAKGERLSLDNYPSTYLSECEGIAYIYNVKKKLRLGIRAVKNCGKIKIDGVTQRMEKYPLGYRFETSRSLLDSIRVTVFSRKNKLNDSFIIENKRGGVSQIEQPISDSLPVTMPDKQNRSLKILKSCGRSFPTSAMKNYCHDTLLSSVLNIDGLAKFCAKSNYVSTQKNCLREAIKFTYQPLETMFACNEFSDIGRQANKCYDLARKFEHSPAKIIQQCRTMYDTNSLRFKCIERFVSEKKPHKSMKLLQACKSEFGRNSTIDKCFDKTSLIQRNKKKTLLACSKSFDRESSKFKCLDLAAKIDIDPEGVILECRSQRPRVSDAFKCITKFTGQ